MLRPFASLRGCSLTASDGEIGTVYEFYFDDKRWTVRYLVVDIGSWLDAGLVLVSPEALAETDSDAGTIHVNLSKEEVRCAAAAESDSPVSLQEKETVQRREELALPTVTAARTQQGAFAPASRFTKDARDSAAHSSSRNLRCGDPHLRSSGALTKRYAIRSQNGIIGTVDDFIVDDREWRVNYFVIHVGGWLFGKRILLEPEWVKQISADEQEICVDLPRCAMKDAPRFNPFAPITQFDQQRLHYFYRRERNCRSVRARR